jgi:7-keto-8-aminopelargonate synthetase-like enzyme
MHPRLKQGTIDAVLRYGTQFASSRCYLSAPPYRELEHLLQRIVDAPVLVTPTTTLGHLTAIPTLIGENDAVIMDQQVHHSVQVEVSELNARAWQNYPASGILAWKVFERSNRTRDLSLLRID